MHSLVERGKEARGKDRDDIYVYNWRRRPYYYGKNWEEAEEPPSLPFVGVSNLTLEQARALAGSPIIPTHALKAMPAIAIYTKD